jgi:hypothetical protein
MDKDKSLLETLTDTIRAAAESIAHPTEGTPMEMPLNESGYALTHLQSVPKPAAKRTAKKKKTAGKPAKRSTVKKSKSAASKNSRKAVGKPKKNVVKKAAKKAAPKKKAATKKKAKKTKR